MAETFEAMREGGTGPDTIWLDGEFVDWADAQVHVLTHALHYGTAVFEGVRCYDTEAGPAIFRWEDHLERFSASARALGIEVPYDRAALTTAATGLIARADLGACYLRPLAFYGYGRLGVDPDGNPARTTIAAWPWGTYLGEDALTEGIEVAVSSWRRYAGEAIPTTVKATGPYVNGALASREARANGYDEALLLNAAGRVAEGPGENLFLVRDGELYTPGLAEDVLSGITRESVVRLARDLGYAVHDDASIGRGELYTADELFFTGTAAEVTPIASVDDVPVGEGGRGPITGEVQSRFFDVVSGRAPGYDDWFTPVEAAGATNR